MLYAGLCADSVSCGSCELMSNSIHGGDVYRNKVDLDFSVNVNPIGIDNEIKNRIKVKLKICEKYPDENQEKLKLRIAEREKVEPSRILCGNGASELLMAIGHGFHPKKILLPTPSFLGYEKLVKAINGTPVLLPLREEKQFLMDEEWVERLEEYCRGEFLQEEESLSREKKAAFENIAFKKGIFKEGAFERGIYYRMLILTNPNNPTGRLIPKCILIRILNICMKYGILVILDECFIEFVKNYRELTMVDVLEQYPNLVLLRAFTKYFAMPGLRLGYLMCSNMEIINKIQMQLPEWNVSLLAQEAGIAALECEQSYMGTSDMIARERTFLVEGLTEVFRDAGKKLEIYPSDANFILFRACFPLYERMLKRGILIRDCSNYRGLGEGFYRIAVRGHEENLLFMEALRAELYIS